MRKACLTIILLILVLAILGAAVYYLSPFHDRLAYYFETWSAAFFRRINPPEAFVPKEAAQPSPTLIPIPTRRATPTLNLTPLPTNQPAPEIPPSATPTRPPPPLPPQALLNGIQYELEGFNNCGPANLDMALSFWGWKANQGETADYLKPNARDRNVMPYEMIAFVQEKTGLHAVTRVGGDVQMLKSLIAGGFPVIVEKGYEIPGRFDGWMGHYQVVHGYQDNKGLFNVEDSFAVKTKTVTYDELLRNWRAFNYLYIVVYPPQLETTLLSILGPQADLESNYRAAADRAAVETQSLTGRDKFFAWFNRGTSLVYLKDYAEAATVYDAAFAAYAALPKEQRPWRMLWYQTGPYFAYFYTQRYQDLIDLATTTLKTMPDPVLEESFYWRGRAEAASGEANAAITDFRKSLEVHPGFTPALEQLKDLGGAQ